MRILGARLHIFELGSHFGFGNCEGLGQRKICEGVGLRWKIWARGGGEGGGGKGEEKIQTPHRSTTLALPFAPTLYRASIKLQSKRRHRSPSPFQDRAYTEG